MLSLCTWEGVRGPFVLVCGILRVPLVVHVRITSINCVWCDLRGALALRCLCIIGMSTPVSRNWMSSGTSTKSTGSSSWCCCWCGDVVAGDVVLLMKLGLVPSIVDNVLGVLSFFLFQFMDVFRCNKPCIIVLQIITLSGFTFFIFHQFIQVVFPSFGWSSCPPLGLCRDDESWGSHSAVRLSWLVWQLGELIPFHFLLCLDTVCDVLCQHFSSASFVILLLCAIQSSKSSSWLAVLSSSSSNEILLSLSYPSCVLSSS